VRSTRYQVVEDRYQFQGPERPIRETDEATVMNNEDHQQISFLRGMKEGEISSCKYLSRKFIHSANAYFYSCSSDVDMDGCPKLNNEGIGDVGCFKFPTSFILGEDNNDDGDFIEK
jgi:hypothetical protein